MQSGWEPKVKFDEWARLMVRADLEKAKKEAMEIAKPMDVIFADSRIISWTATCLRKIPYSRALSRRIRNTRFGQILKTILIKIVQG